MDAAPESDSLRQLSARSEWKAILGLALGSMVIAVAMLFLFEKQNWIIKFGKYIEFQIFPVLTAVIMLGILWFIRAILGIRRCSNETFLDEKEYYLLNSIKSDDLIKDRIKRYSVAILVVTVAAGLNASSGAPDTLKVSFVTEWLPVLLYISAGIFAFELLILGIALALAGLLIWGITSLPTSLAIIIGAVIIAYAIYRRRN